jgi:hypothetical protein
MILAYAHDNGNYNHLIGKKVRGSNMIILGEIVDIVCEYDRWRHRNVYAVLDTGRRISCRAFDKSKV